MCVPLYTPLCAPIWRMGHMFYCAQLFIYYDVKTDDVDTDAHGEDNYDYRPLVKYKNYYLPLTWKVV